MVVWVVKWWKERGGTGVLILHSSHFQNVPVISLEQWMDPMFVNLIYMVAVHVRRMLKGPAA